MSLNIVAESKTGFEVEEELKTCSKCGFKVPKNLVVCWNCGSHFEPR